jgi:AcrR family transcriptional regulator
MRGEKPSYHHTDLRADLLETAARIVAETGVEGVTMRELARRTGVSRTAPYRHFSDKTELLAAVAEEGFRRLSGAIRTAQDAANPASGLENAFSAYVEFAVKNPAHYRMMFGPKFLDFSLHPSLAKTAREAFEELETVILEIQQAGGCRSGPTFDLALVCWSMAHGMSMLFIDGRIPPGKSVHAITRLARRSLLNGMLHTATSVRE